LNAIWYELVEHPRELARSAQAPGSAEGR
jgi:hypothetical protein